LDTFVKLAEGKTLEPRLAPLTSQTLFKTVREACEDNRRGYERRGVTFEIDRQSLDAIDSANVLADHDLLEQAINNLLDNAFKYSYANTEIRVSAHVESDRFSLRISNVGFEIRAEDIPRLRKRGERGEKAQLATGQGAGLGWWLVDNI